MKNTEVRIPLYDGPWDGLVDVQKTLKHVVEELRVERESVGEEHDMIFIQIEWESAAKNDEEFMALVNKYVPNQFWLRFERI